MNEFKKKKPNRPSIFIHCNYVYGIGHFVRVVELSRGLCEHFEIYLINGGEPVPNYNISAEINYIQIPAIYSVEKQQKLMPVDQNLNLKQCLSMRSSIIKKLVCKVKPDLLITEHFPFGPLFETEAISLITQVKKNNLQSKIVSCVRDVILTEEGSARDSHVCSLINKWYDLILVHGDPNIVPFKSSFPMVEKIQIPFHYTGYIVQSIEQRRSQSNWPILLVSVGGGRMGGELLDAVLKAHETIARQWQHQLVLFIGAFQKDKQRLHEYVKQNNLHNVKIHQFDKEHYHRILSEASAVICMGGYNSLLEAVSIEKPVLIYNRLFHGNNQEQKLRMVRFQQEGVIRIINSDELDREKLADLILDALKNFRDIRFNVKIDGVSETLKILKGFFH